MTDNDLSPAQTRSYLHGLAELSGKSDADKPAWLQATPDDGRRNKRSGVRRDRSEANDQEAIIEWARMHQDPRIRELRSNVTEAIFLSLGYGGGVSPKQISMLMGRLIARGVRKGIPDLELNHPGSGYHGFFAELKRQQLKSGGKIVRRQGVVTPEQQAVHDELRAAGNYVVVTYSVRQCCDEIEGYFGL